MLKNVKEIIENVGLSPSVDIETPPLAEPLDLLQRPVDANLMIEDLIFEGAWAPVNRDGQPAPGSARSALRTHDIDWHLRRQPDQSVVAYIQVGGP